MRKYPLSTLCLRGLVAFALANGTLAQDREEFTKPKMPLEQVLNPDGTLNLNKDFQSLDPMGWQMQPGPHGEPRFVPAGEAHQTASGAPLMAVPGDENWDDRFGTLGLNNFVHAIAVSGNEVHAGGGFTTAGGKPSSFSGRDGSNSAAVCADNSDFLLKWGYASGTQGNEIITPVDIAFDSQGNAYVVDIFIQKVTVFDPNGNFVNKWGQTGTGPGFFNALEVEIYNDQVYLLTQNGVDVFDLQGSYIRNTGVIGNSFAMDAAGNIYARGTLLAISKFSNTGTLLDSTPFNASASSLKLTIDLFGNMWAADGSSSSVLFKYDSNLNLVGAFAGYGAALGKLAFPGRLDADAAGNVYVADLGNRRVQKFGNNGAALATFGTAGTGPGVFSVFGAPVAVAIDPSGTLHVADPGDSQIEKWDSSHNFLNAYGQSYGPGSLGEQLPDVAVEQSSGNVLVLSVGAAYTERRVEIFDPIGDFISNLGQFGPGDGDFQQPRALTVDSQGNIYVTDAGGLLTSGIFVKKFDRNGNFLLKWGGAFGSGAGQFNGISGIATDNQNLVYVVDPPNGRVQVFNASGVWQRNIGSSGTGNGQLSFPGHVAVDASGNVFISDGLDRIQKFDNTGLFVATWGVSGSGPGEFDRIGNLDIDVDGNIYATDTRNSRVQKFDNTGTFLLEWGQFGTNDGQFNSPRGIAVNAQRDVYVADQNNSRVQRFGCPPNSLPTVATGGPYSVNEGGSVVVNASGSDPENGPLTYAWDIDNDGIFETPGQSATFDAIDRDGPSDHIITVQVTDNGGLTATAQTTVNVLNVAPTAAFTVTPSTIIVGQSAALSFSNPSDPGTADVAAGFTYLYDCLSAGTFEVIDETQPSHLHSYPLSGIFTAVGRIKDKDGGFTDYTAQVEVLTPQDAVQDLITQVQALNTPQGNGLIGKLNVVIDRLDDNSIDKAIEMLQQFIAQVEVFMGNGTLTEGEGRPLVEAAHAVIAALSNPLQPAAAGLNKDAMVASEVPAELQLAQNFPNPFNPTTMIQFSVPHESQVRLSVYNLMGKEVATLVNRHLTPGTYQFNWDASHLASGFYIYRLEAEGFSQTKRMFLMK